MVWVSAGIKAEKINLGLLTASAGQDGGRHGDQAAAEGNGRWVVLGGQRRNKGGFKFHLLDICRQWERRSWCWGIYCPFQMKLIKLPDFKREISKCQLRTWKAGDQWRENIQSRCTRWCGGDMCPLGSFTALLWTWPCEPYLGWAGMLGAHLIGPSISKHLLQVIW